MAAKIRISSTTYSKSYLTVAWQTRNQLEDYERRGFAIFVYLTISAHLESVLVELLRHRCQSIRYMLRWEELPPMELLEGAQKHLCDLKPIYESLFCVVAEFEKKSYNAPLSNLKELYNVLFSPSIRLIVGDDLYEDLLALADLRNMFAHGRDFFLEYPFTATGGSFLESNPKASLESNPIKKSALRLYKAGIIKDLNITNQKQAEFQSAFFADDAILYFYRAVEEIEQKLLEKVTFLPEQEQFTWTLSKLPKLEA